jgi:hypothetical protein
MQPESGMRFEHYSRDAFFKAIQSHRLANGYEITPDWKERIEDQICREHAAEWGQEICRRVQNLGGRRAISFAAAQSFLNTMASWLVRTAKGEAAFVSQEEANRRAAICVTCPNNVHSFGGSCGSCADRIMRALAHVVGKRSTPYDHNLGACAICSCSLAAAVHVPLEPQQAGLDEGLKIEFKAIPWCWKRVGL